MISNVDSELLGIHAAGLMNGDGSGIQSFGCELSRMGVGTYVMTLPEDGGLEASQSYLFVQARIVNLPLPPLLFLPAVADNGPFTKTIRMFDLLGNAVDASFSAILFRTAGS